MKKANKPINIISPEYREAFSILTGSKQYPALIQFLKTQQNNIVVLEWFRIKSYDSNIKEKKAYYEGQFDFIRDFIKIMESCKKGQDE